LALPRKNNIFQKYWDILPVETSSKNCLGQIYFVKHTGTALCKFWLNCILKYFVTTLIANYLKYSNFYAFYGMVPVGSTGSQCRKKTFLNRSGVLFVPHCKGLFGLLYFKIVIVVPQIKNKQLLCLN
jgi:hypothetical protein